MSLVLKKEGHGSQQKPEGQLKTRRRKRRGLKGLCSDRRKEKSHEFRAVKTREGWGTGGGTEIRRRRGASYWATLEGRSLSSAQLRNRKGKDRKRGTGDRHLRGAILVRRFTAIETQTPAKSGPTERIEGWLEKRR